MKPLTPTTIRRRLAALSEERHAENEKWMGKLYAINERMRAVQARCEHAERYRCGDDNDWHCPTCGLDLE